MPKIKGKGSIVALEKPIRTCEKWQLRVSVGYDYMTKSYHTKTRQFHGRKTAAREALRGFINELESGIRTDTTELTLGEFADRWLEEREKGDDLQAGTLRNSRNSVKTIKKSLGSIKVIDLNPETVSSFYLALRSPGFSTSGKALSGTSARKIAISLSQILDVAVNRDIIVRNPCDKVKKPSIDTEEKVPLTDAQAVRLTKLLYEGKPDAHRIGAMLALECGMRREEVLGLTWGSLDETNRTINITRVRPSDRPLDGSATKRPKTKAGARTLPLYPATLERLLEWKGEQKTILTRLDLLQTDERPIVTSEIGGYMHPENFGRWWDSFRERNGYQGIGLHHLRHTCMTNLMRNGVDLKTIQHISGDADISTLMHTYIHYEPGNARPAIESVGDIYHGKIKTNVVEYPAKKEVG